MKHTLHIFLLHWWGNVKSSIFSVCHMEYFAQLSTRHQDNFCNLLLWAGKDKPKNNWVKKNLNEIHIVVFYHRLTLRSEWESFCPLWLTDRHGLAVYFSYLFVSSGFNRCSDSSDDAGDAWKVCILNFTSCVIVKS